MLGVAHEFARMKEPAMMIAALLALDCYLRPKEIDDARRSSLHLSGAMIDVICGTLRIKRSKRKAIQTVPIRNRALTRQIRRLLSLRKSGKLFPFTKGQWRAKMIIALRRMEIPVSLKLTPACLWPDGATYDFYEIRSPIEGISTGAAGGPSSQPIDMRRKVQPRGLVVSFEQLAPGGGCRACIRRKRQ